MALCRLPHVLGRRPGRHDADRFRGHDSRRETEAAIWVEDPNRVLTSGWFDPMYRHGTDRKQYFHFGAVVYPWAW